MFLAILVLAIIHPGFVLVGGESGVGKSRLCAELFGYIESRPGLVRWRQGRCLPSMHGISKRRCSRLHLIYHEWYMPNDIGEEASQIREKMVLYTKIFCATSLSFFVIKG